ncbi:TIGR00341 family protein [Thiocapsa imhoffii]|uniref:TIGR00341 family protein n=1 Tax=Thiocapsa imhoffii TaxID=382777 RepID=A0A9X1BA46_9GAMM|nr:TIGR00341 family protein [Thiocapsa imhoffii]MBK1645725.1 TIGR00341 family protein [Thiocapsa imhoffii]
MRIVEVIADTRHAQTLVGMARFYGADDYWWGGQDQDGRCSLRMLVPDDRRQALLDALQDLFKAHDRARIVVQSVDAVLTHEGQDDQDLRESKAATVAATREELYSEIAKGAKLDSNYLILTLLSTLVAAIGLVENNVAVIIGAMVIAPLLGPNIALAFATSLGDRELTWRAMKTNGAGLGLALLVSVAIALVVPVSFDSPELLARTDVDLGGVVLGLASGAAAVLSLTTGLSSTLVGVMVAVALLPPTATMGMMLGGGRWEEALGAFLLLVVNIVCVLLAAKIVFLLKGVRPRSWTERNRAKQSMTIYLSLWVALLLILIGVILVRAAGWHLPDGWQLSW